MSTLIPVAEHTTLLDWLLRPFARIRAGEGPQALLMMLCIFLVLTSYYLMKTAREGLILTGGGFGLRGEELKSYSGAAMAVALVALVPAYAALASRVRRLRLINVSHAIVIASLLGFFVLARAGAPIGLAFFVWIGLVNMFVVAQFWSYANDLYSEEQGRRLFAIIAIGGSIGAVVGPELAKLATTYTLLPCAAVLLAASLAVFNVIERLHARRAPANDVGRQPIDGSRVIDLLRRDRVVLLIAALVFVAELVKTNGEYVLSSAATSHALQAVPATAHPELVGAARDAAITADRRELIKAFYSNFFLWVNLISLAVQAFAVSRILEKLGVRGALFVMPVIALGAYGAIAAIGGIALVRAAKVAENATEYSVQNTVRQALFLKTGRPVKYKVKAAIDTFVVRAADTLSALFVWLSVALGMDGRGLAIINLALIGVWLAIAVAISRRHANAAPPRVGSTPSLDPRNQETR